MRFISLQRPPAVLAWRAPLAVAGLIGLLLCVGALVFAQGAVAQDSSSGLDQYLERTPDAGGGSGDDALEGEIASSQNGEDGGAGGAGGGSGDGGGSGAVVLGIVALILVGGTVAWFVVQRRRGGGESAGESAGEPAA